MQSDADRFRPRDSGPLAEQSPPAAEGDGQQATPRPEPKPFQAQSSQPQPSAQQPARRRQPQGDASSLYGAPRYGATQPGAGQFGAGRFGGGQSGARSAQPARYAPPPQGTARFAPALDGSDAPLIHPAAAQASEVLPYGVPVYRTPVYAYAPPPQRGLSITALVLGICSFLFAWTLVVVPIIGIVFGGIAIRREPAGKAMAVIGLTGSIVGLMWVLLFYLLPLAGILMAMVVAAGSS